MFSANRVRDSFGPFVIKHSMALGNNDYKELVDVEFDLLDVELDLEEGLS